MIFISIIPPRKRIEDVTSGVMRGRGTGTKLEDIL